jgi:hypothetical protein
MASLEYALSSRIGSKCVPQRPASCEALDDRVEEARVAEVIDSRVRIEARGNARIACTVAAAASFLPVPVVVLEHAFAGRSAVPAATSSSSTVEREQAWP